MDDIKKYEPLWGAWYIDGEPLGEGSFGKVYKVRREEFGTTHYAAVKMLTIPQSDEDLKRVRNEGLDEASARSYFQSFVTDIVQEVNLMSEFKGISNVVSLEDYVVIEKKGAIGWDILIRMELLTTLSNYIHVKTLTPDDVMKIGIDIAHALELCAVKNIIHRDIKPDNIFVSQYEDYKLGDFGIARHIERTTSGLSKKGTPTYMAPEVYKGEDYGPSVDLYSLGLVMYRYLNNNRTPFMPPFPEQITPKDRETALKRRIDGEQIPDIPDIDPELNAFVLKACAFRREDRFKDAEEFRTELERIAGVKSKPSVREIKPESVRTPSRKRARAMRQEDDGHTMGVFSVKRGESQEVPEDVKPEVPARIMNALSMTGAVCAGLLTLLCLFSGSRGDILVSMPLYAMCVALCVLHFRHSALNAVFIVAMICYLAFSALMNISAFDYPLLSLTLGLLAVESMRAGSPKYRRVLSITLGVCALVSAVLIFRASGGSESVRFKALIASSYGVPLMMFIVCGLVLLPELEDGKVIAGLSALQMFTLIAFVMFLLGVMFGGESQVMINIANASLVGFSPEKFSWWRYGRFLGLVLQTIMCECLVCLAAAKMIPDVFLGMMENRKKAVIAFAVCILVIIAGILAVSLMG